MTDTKTALSQLGWRVDTTDRLTQAIKDFQTGWALGPALAVDGNDGPKTRDALALSVLRLNAGLPTASPHFSFTEFRCACGGKDQTCRRIWVHRALVLACERYRADYVGPLKIVRGCRCPTQNAAVGGKSQSQHLFGTGVDVEVYDINPWALAKGAFVSGIGRYSTRDGRLVVRHFDVRHVWTDWRNTTASTVTSPAHWPYGETSLTPLTPRPAGDDPAPTAPTTAPPQEDDMSAEDTARLKAIETALNNLASAEAGRYSVATGRYNHHSGILTGIAEKVGAPVDIDEAALAAGVAATVAPLVAAAVSEAAKAQGIPNADTLADAVVTRLGAKLAQEA